MVTGVDLTQPPVKMARTQLTNISI